MHPGGRVVLPRCARRRGDLGAGGDRVAGPGGGVVLRRGGRALRRVGHRPRVQRRLMRGGRGAAPILACVVFAAAAAAHAAETRGAHAYLRLAPAVERIARLHAQSGQDVMGARSRRALAEAVRDFHAGLPAALAAAPGPEARENYVLLAMLWQDYREWVHRAPSRQAARKLRERTEEMAWVASKGVRLGSETPRASVASAGLTASQAAAASQRIAKG